MGLYKQKYQIEDRGKIEEVGHLELLGNNKQIIRLQEDMYNEAKGILLAGKNLSLYNHYNPINIDLIRSFKENYTDYNGAMISKIIGSYNNQPILDISSLKEVTVHRMGNILFEDIENTDLINSLSKGKTNTVKELIEWLSKDFYKGNYSIKDIIKSQKLFFRQINLKENEK